MPQNARKRFEGNPPKTERNALKIAIIITIALAVGAHAEPAPRIGANTAPADSLQMLPGVGPTIAQRIIDARPFTRCEDLTETVKGIGEKKIVKICPLLKF